MTQYTVTYLVHDLSDTTVAKRARMMKHAGATINLAGFYRSETPPDSIAETAPHALGRTINGGFVNRCANVIKICVNIKAHKHLFEGSNVLVARNLEMLAVAVRAKSAFKMDAKIIYESIDIHRLLLRNDPIGGMLRGLEGYLGRRADKLWTSSPAFIGEYFEKRAKFSCPIQLVENKIFDPNGIVEAQSKAQHPIAISEPWIIGWFGAIRCHKSLTLLRNLTNHIQGRVNVVISGKVAKDQVPDFDRIIADNPYISFEGVYKNPDDLADIYGSIHFSWAIDMFEEGLNSSWLLPNRLYEGGLFHAVPITLETVETGKQAKEMGIGVQLPHADLPSLNAFFENLDKDHYEALQNASKDIPSSRWLHDDAECNSLLQFEG